jgi:hypothetical protein
MSADQFFEYKTTLYVDLYSKNLSSHLRRLGLGPGL